MGLRGWTLPGEWQREDYRSQIYANARARAEHQTFSFLEVLSFLYLYNKIYCNRLYFSTISGGFCAISM